MKFIIRGAFYGDKCFPSLNDYLAEMGRHPQLGGRMKRDYKMIAVNAIRRDLKRRKPKGAVILHYRFYEPPRGQKRDRMNVFAFADKVIEDALQDCKVIPDDGPDIVKNATHDFFSGDPAIEVEIEEIG